MLVTLGRFNVNEVLPFKTDEKIRKEYTTPDGKTYRVWMNSERYKLFSKSRVCCCCGLEGTYFLLQNNDSNQDDITTGHFNLFGDDPELGPTKFTKDHINPKSKGGKNTSDNYQTMCFTCNFLRGTNNIPFEVILEARKTIKEHGLPNAIFAIKEWVTENLKGLPRPYKLYYRCVSCGYQEGSIDSVKKGCTCKTATTIQAFRDWNDEYPFSFVADRNKNYSLLRGN